MGNIRRSLDGNVAAKMLVDLITKEDVKPSGRRIILTRTDEEVAGKPRKSAKKAKKSPKKKVKAKPKK